MASSFKGLTGSQSSGPGREDVVHEPDRAEGSLFVHGEALERPDQVGLALASVQMVLAQPGTGAVQQLCRRPAQSQGNALRQGLDRCRFQLGIGTSTAVAGRVKRSDSS